MQDLKHFLKEHPKAIRLVQYLLIGLFVFLVFFDIFLAATGNITISEVIKGETEKGFFVLTYLWGVVAINLFFTRKDKRLVHEITGTFIILVVAALIYFFKLGPMLISYIGDDPTDIRIAHAISMIFGLIMGYFFWRQDHDA